MAKGKHSAALFEVIHSDKRFKKTGSLVDQSGSLKTPKWWFKGKEKAEAKAAAASTAPPAAVTDSSEPGWDPTQPAATPSTTSAVDSKPSVELDPERNQINFKLTYNSAIVGGFAVVVVIAMIFFVANRRSGPAVAQAKPDTILPQLKQPVQSGVLNVKRTTTNPGATPAAKQTAKAVEPIEDSVNSSVQPKSTTSTPVEAVDDGDFVNGLNYVIAQAYPNAESAKRVGEAMLKSGFKVRVVRGPTGHTQSWYSVVGTRGFSRISGPEYQAYVKRMMDSAAALPTKMRFDQIKPSTVKWQGHLGEVKLEPPADGAPAPARR